MTGSDGWWTDLWRQLQQVEVTSDDGVKAPVTVDGKDGIVIGNPPVGTAARGRMLQRFKLRLARS